MRNAGFQKFGLMKKRLNENYFSFQTSHYTLEHNFTRKLLLSFIFVFHISFVKSGLLSYKGGEELSHSVTMHLRAFVFVCHGLFSLDGVNFPSSRDSSSRFCHQMSSTLPNATLKYCVPDTSQSKAG